MSKELDGLLKAARKVPMTTEQREEQRQSFAYGNTRFENELITKETVGQAAERLTATNENDNG